MCSDQPRWPGCGNGANLTGELQCIYRDTSFARVPTKRTSPESSHGFVVNHSHMKALVEPSLTESMRPLMSLFTGMVEYLGTGEIGSGDRAPWNFNVVGDHPCWRAITKAIV